jgi:hypothetical protein
VGKPEIDNGNMIMVIESTQVLSSDFLHQVVVSVDVSVGLSEKYAHGAFPQIDEQKCGPEMDAVM